MSPPPPLWGGLDKAQKEIAIDFPVVSSITVTPVTVGTVQEVTTGIIDIISATYEDGDYPLSSISVSGNNLVFALAADSVTVVIHTLYPDFTSISSNLSVHPLLQPIILDYLISLYYDSEAEGDPEESSIAREFYQRWMFYKSQVISTLTTTNVYTQRSSAYN